MKQRQMWHLTKSSNCKVEQQIPHIDSGKLENQDWTLVAALVKKAGGLVQVTPEDIDSLAGHYFVVKSEDGCLNLTCLPKSNGGDA